VGNLFGMTRGNAHYCIMEVCTVIAEHLKPLYIQWPNDDACRKISTAFELSSGFPNVIGCIDGTHIPIKAPSADRNSFINRKGYPSINVLAVCDNSMRFTYVYADRADSVHDARVLRVSSLGQDIESGRIVGNSKFHLLGDSAYPLLPNLMVPFRDNGHLTPMQMRFNAVIVLHDALLSGHSVVLKVKFRRLRGIDATRLSNAVRIIESAFTLHNFILEREDDDCDEFDCECDASTTDNLPRSEAAFANAKQKALAQTKRDSIASVL
jgi:hypothetical protein